MPGFDEFQKPCDIETSTNTIKSFLESNDPSDRSSHLAVLTYLASEIQERPVSLTEIFGILSRTFDVAIDTRAGGKFRSMLYDDYYPQTRKGEETEIKGEQVIYYQYDNQIYCTIPLVVDPDRNGRRLWGIQFKPEFVKCAKSFKIPVDKIKKAFDKL